MSKTIKITGSDAQIKHVLTELRYKRIPFEECDRLPPEIALIAMLHKDTPHGQLDITEELMKSIDAQKELRWKYDKSTEVLSFWIVDRRPSDFEEKRKEMQKSTVEKFNVPPIKLTD